MKTSIKVSIVRSFTHNPNQGNPAGVVIDGHSFSDQKIVQVAAKLGYSESVFVRPSSRADVKVIFSSPTRLINLCGHGTVAAFHAWIAGQPDFFSKERVVSKTMETWRGDILQILCHSNGKIEMFQKQTEYGATAFDPAEVARLLRLRKEDICHQLPIQMVSTGTPKLIIPLKDRDRLFQIHPDFPEIARFCEKHDCYGFYPFYQTNHPDFDAEARQFNPRMGIDEDPVTGVAAAALGAYLCAHRKLKKDQMIVRQGYHMNRGGEIYVTVGQPMKIGGYAVTEKVMGICVF